MPYDEEPEERIDRIVLRWPNTATKKMPEVYAICSTEICWAACIIPT